MVIDLNFLVNDQKIAIIFKITENFAYFCTQAHKVAFELQNNQRKFQNDQKYFQIQTLDKSFWKKLRCQE